MSVEKYCKVKLVTEFYRLLAPLFEKSYPGILATSFPLVHSANYKLDIELLFKWWRLFCFSLQTLNFNNLFDFIAEATSIAVCVQDGYNWKRVLKSETRETKGDLQKSILLGSQ